MITEVTVRVRPAPAARRYEAWVAADFGAGRELVRTLAQDGALADVTRLSDEAETRVTLGLAGARGAAAALLDTYLPLARPQRRLPDDLRVGGRPARTWSAAGRSRPACCAAAGPCHSARPPAAPGSGAASTARICATS